MATEVHGTVPAYPSSFVGRREERRQLKELLGPARMITLTGPGGVGKTRLVVAVTQDLAPRFDGAAWFVRLDHLRDPALVIDTVANAVGMRTQSRLSSADPIAVRLGRRRGLLVLDNCEHLGDDCADLVETLLQQCPGLHVLVTSRHPLGVSGETTFAVAPLAVPRGDASAGLAAYRDRSGQEGVSVDLLQYSAVNLFVERARAALPSFELAAGNQDDVVALCQQLDGLPLAIELAANRVRALSPGEIVRGLADGADRLLAGAQRTAPPRQQSLGRCVEWSYELCTSDERLLWAKASVFTGGFDLDALVALVDGELPAARIRPLVAALVDQSMLLCEDAGGTVRYRILETMREYGDSILRARGDRLAVHQSHLGWVELLVERAERAWISADQRYWMRRLRNEHANIRQALDHALRAGETADRALDVASGLHTYWLAEGRLSEGRYWLRRSLEADGPCTMARLRALHSLVWLTLTQSDIESAMPLATEARELGCEIGGDSASAVVHVVDGILASALGDRAAAAEHFGAAAVLFERTGETLRRVEALFWLVLTHAMAGDAAATRKARSALRDLTVPAGESWYDSYATWCLGLVTFVNGDLSRADETVRESLQTRVAAQPDPLGFVTCVETLAWVASASRRAERAATLFGAADRLWQEAGTSPAAWADLGRFREPALRQARDRLGPAVFTLHVRRGALLTRDEVLTVALEGTGPDVEEGLSPREAQVAELVAGGLTNSEIADRLVISRRTAEGHVNRIIHKLGLRSRVQVALWWSGTRAVPGGVAT